MKKTQYDKASPAFRALSFSKLGRVFGVIFLAMLCTYIIDRLGLSQKLESKVLEWVMTRSGPTPDIAIVEISNAEYNDFFDGRSPLKPTKLQDLVGAIAKSGPRVIAVDIDTSHPDFRDLQLDKRWRFPIIWERDTLNVAETGKIEPTDILGGQDPRLNSSAGIPLLLDDPEDKVTRLYTRCINIGGHLEPSFTFAAAEAYRSGSSGVNDPATAEPCGKNGFHSEQEFFIDWWPRSAWTVKAAGDVLVRSASEKDGVQPLSCSDVGVPVRELCGRLVLLGGTYLDVDRHFTPLGKEAGLFVLANSIQTDLDSPVRAYWKPGLLALQVIAGTALFLILHLCNFSLRKLLLCGSLVAVVLALGFGAVTVLLFRAFREQQFVHIVLANFLPMSVAVVMFDIIEHIRGSVLPRWFESPHI